MSIFGTFFSATVATFQQQKRHKFVTKIGRSVENKNNEFMTEFCREKTFLLNLS